MATEPIDTIDLEDTPDESPAETLARRHPLTPTTLSELALLKGGAVEIIEARAQILETLRLAAIRATHPSDWVLFRAPEGQVTGYLQDAGCDRVRDLFGIEVCDVGRPEKVAGATPGEFHYLITGSGRCKLTRQTIDTIEGGRSSTDDFVKGKTGVELELLVRKAARANLDGNVTRELAAMKSVPDDELARAWQGSAKRVEECHRGRGFGTRDERLGGASSKAPDVPAPVCAICGSTGVYRPARDGRRAFFGCANFSKHPQQKWIVDAEQWVREQAQKAVAVPDTASEPLTADDVFGKKTDTEKETKRG